MIHRFRIKPFWFILVMLCLIVGIISLIPSGADGDGMILPYQSVIPLAPVSTLLLWLLGLIFYVLGRRFTDRPIRKPSQ